MMRNFFSVRLISLAVIVSNLSIPGGAVRLPAAQAQTNPPLNFDPTAPTPAPTPTTSNSQDFFCGQGWEISGFPYDLFDWEEIPWGMPGEEFVRRYKGRLEQCSPNVASGSIGMNADHVVQNDNGKQSGGTVEFTFRGENNALSRIRISRVPDGIREHLVQRYGVPRQASYAPIKVRVGCVREGIACPPVFEYKGEELYSGVWWLPETLIELESPHNILLIPANPDLRDRSACDKFLIFKACSV